MNRASKLARRWVLTLLGLCGLFAMLWHFEHSQVYHPDRVVVPTREALGRESEDVWFKAEDGTQLNGWFYPHENSKNPGAVAVLFCHGNAGNISHRVSMCGAMLEAGVSVLVFDYRGYGASAGRPSETGTYQDAQAAYHWLKARGFARIVAFGESLGGGVASELAVREPLAGLILQGTFTSIADVGAELFPWLPVRWMSRIKYDTYSRLPRIQVPLLIMHSREDTLIRFHHAERNYTAANQPKLLWELQGDHNDALQEEKLFIRGLGQFMGLLETSRESNISPGQPSGISTFPRERTSTDTHGTARAPKP